MKRLIFLMLPFFFIGCSAQINIPDRAQRDLYNKDTQRIKISKLLETDIENEKKIVITSHEKSPEAIMLMKFIVPLLYENGDISLSFWFLDGNSDADIMAFLNNSDGAPSAEELLFNSDPRISGYEEYRGVLVYLRDFYNKVPDKELINISNSQGSKIHFDLYDSDFDDSETIQYLIHSPIRTEKGQWEFPFQGELYFMMIHDWFFEAYSAIVLKDSVLEDMYLSKIDETLNKTAGSYIDAILLMGYPEQYKDFSPLDSFINEGNIAEALQYYPRQIIREKTKPASYIVNNKVNRSHRKLSRSLKKNYEKILDLEPFREE